MPAPPRQTIRWGSSQVGPGIKPKVTTKSLFMYSNSVSKRQKAAPAPPMCIFTPQRMLGEGQGDAAQRQESSRGSCIEARRRGRKAKRGVPRDLSLPPGASGKGMQVGLKGGAQGLATAPWCARGRLPQRGLPGAWQLPRLESEACT